MARGKKTSPEVIYRVMTSWAITDNYNETSKALNMAVSSVKKIVEDNKDKPEFEKLCKDKKDTFVEKADEIIDILLERIIRETTDEEKDIPLNQLTTALGTVYDKRALAKGDSTENTKITFDLPSGVDEFAE